MKTAKLMLSLIALVSGALCTALATPKINALTEKLGVPYTVSYIAKHSPNSLYGAFFSDNVIFHETASQGSLYRTYDWDVTFEQNGSVVAEFTTNDYYYSWTTYSSTDEQWNGITTYVPPGTYTVRIKDISGVGNFYEMYAGGVYASHDVNTTREDGVMEGVVVDSSGYVDVGVNRVQ
ncbi:hypothetical protein KXQ82_02130 [Mucilaginibacter sp. HMF5004]|uniref:hypothetical protein n=1 Tax=Mucilaginibacter rivuli TaxID=2857527 RepID=UPI001C5EF167|nr:hypothetical protein [Mucilaginibacter rivuli]MBW4888489.1 hypothetical protein [Mucilaginibacter rivuli]